MYPYLPVPSRAYVPLSRTAARGHAVSHIHMYLMCSGKVTFTLPFFSLSLNPDFSLLARKFIPTRNPFAEKEGNLFPRNAPNSFLRLSHSLTCMVPYERHDQSSAQMNLIIAVNLR